MPTVPSPSPSPSRLSPVVAVMLCLAGCGRDALVNVPGTPDGRADAAVVVAPGAGGTGGAPVGGAGGGRGSDGPIRPPPPITDGPVAPPAVDAAPSCGALPACLTTLASACPTSGACSAQRTATSVNQCYASNVKLVGVVTTQGATAKVTRPDGTLCYVVAGTLGRGGVTGGQVTYSDDSGKVIATGTFQGGGGGGQIVVMCAAGSTPTPPVSVPVTCAPGASALVGLATSGIGACTIGTCPP
jgi:hypothetical protein